MKQLFNSSDVTQRKIQVKQNKWISIFVVCMTCKLFCSPTVEFIPTTVILLLLSSCLISLCYKKRSLQLWCFVVCVVVVWSFVKKQILIIDLDRFWTEEKQGGLDSIPVNHVLSWWKVLFPYSASQANVEFGHIYFYEDGENDYKIKTWLCKSKSKELKGEVIQLLVNGGCLFSFIFMPLQLRFLAG